MTDKKHILMVAAENDFLPGAKVGGVADVLRDLPPALVKQGQSVDVVVPSYGFLARLPGLRTVAEFDVHFAGFGQRVMLLKTEQSNGGAVNYIMHSPALAPKGETVYCNDSYGPFATDATKFAFFCACIAKALSEGIFPRPDVIHCHDWHSAFLLILLRFLPELEAFGNIRSVYTIHNLAMQGVRPFRDDDSSFESWYPSLHYNGQLICDLHNPHCVNPMRAAILLADKVHTVSATYADEILQTSDHANGIFGGEGLESDLCVRAQQGDLLGIINGSEYPKGARYAAPAKKKVLSLAQNALVLWASKQSHMSSAHFVAEKRLQHWALKKTRGFTLTSVGRVTDQKVRLLATFVAPGKTALEAMLDSLGDKGQFILLGSGEQHYEEFLLGVSGRHENFIFLNGYSHELSLNLYRYGDLFVMPSSFEPCGISQMLSMRAGQPCLANQVGGLKDTIKSNVTGFCFAGENAVAQAKALVEAFNQAKTLYETKPEQWKKIATAAADVRFTWEQSARQYVEQLYA